MEEGYLIRDQFKDYLNSVGIDGERIFKESGLPEQIKKNNFYVSREQYINFMNSLEKHADVDAVMRFSDVTGLETFLPPVFAALCAGNGLDCFNRLSTYKKLVGPFRLKMETESDVVSLTMTFDDDNKTPLPPLTQITEALILVNILRTGTGKNITPIEIQTTVSFHRKIVDHLGVTPKNSDKSIIKFSKRDLQMPFTTENNIMWNYLEPEFKKRLEEMEVDETTAARVRTLLTEMIPAGRVGIEDVAIEMGLSPRTLQRKLSGENTTYIKQLNHTRELMAKNFLMNEHLSTEEIAYLLGYSDMYVFMRAFRQWTGDTVAHFRKSVA